jgi:hypothetical protein
MLKPPEKTERKRISHRKLMKTAFAKNRDGAGTFRKGKILRQVLESSGEVSPAARKEPRLK